MTHRRRIVVTGLGVVSCYGSDVEQFYNSLLEGKSGIVHIPEFEELGYPTTVAGPVRDFEVGAYMDRKQARRVDPFISYAMVAGKKALESAGFDLKTMAGVDPEKAGVLLGSGMGGMNTFSQGVTTIKEKGVKRISPFFVPFIITNMAGALLAMDLNLMGPNYSISTACATANYCLVNGAEHIRRGDADVMVCGGTEAALTAVGMGGFVAIKALSERQGAPSAASRPFDQGRDGFVMGEGAGVLVLEELEHAIKRGAPILAEYVGGGLSCDAFHMTAPREDGRGVANCIHYAVRDAGIDPALIDHVNAHATATPAGDVAELLAIKQALPDPSQVVLNATKSLTGHCLGAAAGVEGVATVMAVKTGKIHPTINLDDPEPESQAFQVPTEAMEKEVNYGMSLSFGFGGHNAAVIFKKYNEK